MSYIYPWKDEFPSEGNFCAASSRGRYGNAFSVTGLWSMNKNTQCTWHWQVEAYDVSKWASAGIKGRLWNTSSSFFLSSGDFVSEVWVIMSVEKRFRRCADPCQRFPTPDDTHDLCVMCLGEEHARSVLERLECAHCELFSLGKLRSRMSLFSRKLGQSSAPAARVQLLLRQRGDWGRGDRRWSSLTNLREELISRARQRLTRVNCWRKMYCLLHLLLHRKEVRARISVDAP